MASIASLTTKLAKTKTALAALKEQAAAIKTDLIAAKAAAKTKKVVKAVACTTMKRAACGTCK